MPLSTRMAWRRLRRNLAAAALLVLIGGAPAAAQSQFQTDQLYIGTGAAATTDPFIVQSLPAVGSGSGTINPTVIDSNGVVRKDGNTTVSTSGLWTFSQRATFTGNIRTTAGLISAGAVPLVGLALDNNGDLRKDNGLGVDVSGHWFFSNWLYGPFTVATSAGADAALGFTNFRIHQNAGSVRATWERGPGYAQWTIDNDVGVMRWFRTDAAGSADEVPFYLDGNMHVDPYGKFILPAKPYNTSLGSPGLKFDGLWAANLFVDTLVATETMATTQGRQLIGNGNMFDADASPSDTSIVVRYNNFTNGDYIYGEKDGRFESMQVTSTATSINVIANSSFEATTTGAAPASWDVSASDTLVASLAKSFRGNKAALLTHAGTTLLQIAYNGFASASSTPYTFCGYFRRTDGVLPVVGDITAASRGGTAVNLTVEETGTDGWVRMCGTFTSGVSGDTRAPFLNWSVASGASVVDWYMDGVQLEAGSTVRPYSVSRSSYTVVRNKNGDGANQWIAGDGLFDVGGAVGVGWLDCYAIRGVKSATEFGPSCVANVRTSTTNWNDWEPYAGWGQLNGLWEYGSSTFGFVAGPKSGPHIAVDNVSGIHFWQGTTEKARWDLATGNIQIGNFVTNTPVMLLTASTLQFCVYGGACALTIEGTSGNIHTASATALNTGTGYFLGGTGTFRFGNPAADYVRWDGSNITLISTKLKIDSTGINLTGISGTTFNTTSAYQITSPGSASRTTAFWGYENGGQWYTEVALKSTGGVPGNLILGSNTGLANQAEVKVLSNGSSAADWIGGIQLHTQGVGTSVGADYVYLNTAQVQWNETYVGAGAYYPMITNGGRMQAKTNVAFSTASCPGGQHVSSWVIEGGLVISFSCS